MEKNKTSDSIQTAETSEKNELIVPCDNAAADNVTSKHRKSTFGESIKTISVLVVICLICCILLAVCNDIFYVDEEEQFSRALADVYPGTFTRDTSFSKTPDPTYSSDENLGQVTEVYKSVENDYILKAKGIGGYGGTVTIYVAVSSASATIVGWSIVESDGETLLGNITQKVKSSWYIDESIDSEFAVENYRVSGTTLSSRAINNAVKIAAYYCLNALKIGENSEDEAQTTAVAELLSENGHNDYELSERSDKVYKSADGAIAVQTKGTGGYADGTAIVNVITKGIFATELYIVNSDSRTQISNIAAQQLRTCYYAGNIAEGGAE